MKCSDICKALLKGIRLLKQEPCEDFISRKDAIACCRNEWEEEVADRIEALPSIYPKELIIQSNTPPTAEWEHYADKLYDAAYQHGYKDLKDEMDEMLHVMLESDPRTFSNPVSDYGLYYDAIADVLTKLREFGSGTDNS